MNDAGSSDKGFGGTNVHLETLGATLQGIGRELSPALRKLDQRLQEIAQSIRLSTTTFNVQLVNFQRSVQPIVEQLENLLRELPLRTQKAARSLGVHGWYIDMEMPIPDLWRLSEMFDEGDAHEAENALIEYFESRVDGIEESLVGRYPSRKSVIPAAFSAHRRGDYVLSIPVLLAQTDGIWREAMRFNFFQKRGRKSRTTRALEMIASDTLLASLLVPLTEYLPIAASEHERSAVWSELNRHMVLHGESVDYGNKVNSLKAISLINYVAGVLSFVDEAPSRHSAPQA